MFAAPAKPSHRSFVGAGSQGARFEADVRWPLPAGETRRIGRAGRARGRFAPLSGRGARTPRRRARPRVGIQIPAGGLRRMVQTRSSGLPRLLLHLLASVPPLFHYPLLPLLYFFARGLRPAAARRTPPRRATMRGRPPGRWRSFFSCLPQDLAPIETFRPRPNRDPPGLPRRAWAERSVMVLDGTWSRLARHATHALPVSASRATASSWGE